MFIKNKELNEIAKRVYDIMADRVVVDSFMRNGKEKYIIKAIKSNKNSYFLRNDTGTREIKENLYTKLQSHIILKYNNNREYVPSGLFC